MQGWHKTMAWEIKHDWWQWCRLLSWNGYTYCCQQLFPADVKCCCYHGIHQWAVHRIQQTSFQKIGKNELYVSLWRLLIDISEHDYQGLVEPHFLYCKESLRRAFVTFFCCRQKYNSASFGCAARHSTAVTLCTLLQQLRASDVERYSNKTELGITAIDYKKRKYWIVAIANCTRWSRWYIICCR